MKDVLPPKVRQFAERQSELFEAYQALGKACAQSGPLDERTRRLVKLALAIGARSEGAVHSHARRALEEGMSPSELQHVAALAIPTLGFPAAMAAMTWIGDLSEEPTV